MDREGEGGAQRGAAAVAVGVNAVKREGTLGAMGGTGSTGSILGVTERALGALGAYWGSLREHWEGTGGH